MQLNLYKEQIDIILGSEIIRKQIDEAVKLIEQKNRVFFIGNGGSNAICQHMMEDFAKIAKIPSFSFSNPALITCYSNDYGYENAMKEWLKIHYQADDLLFAISSSGESDNIINTVNYVNSIGSSCISFSGFKKDSRLLELTGINFYVGVENFGIVECIHQILLHIILDTYVQRLNLK